MGNRIYIKCISYYLVFAASAGNIIQYLVLKTHHPNLVQDFPAPNLYGTCSRTFFYLSREVS